MDVLLVIAAWTFGSIVLGLVLGRIFRASAEDRDAEERLFEWLQTGAGKTGRQPRRKRAQGWRSGAPWRGLKRRSSI